MTTLAEAGGGLVAVLKSISDLRVYNGLVSNPMPPAAMVLHPLVSDYRDDQGDGSMTVAFPVLLLVRSNVDRQQLDLYELIEKSGSRSVFAAIEADRTLGGLDVDARVVNVEDFDTERFGLNDYFGRVVNVVAVVTA